jgi:hypothetical protein
MDLGRVGALAGLIVAGTLSLACSSAGASATAPPAQAGAERPAAGGAGDGEGQAPAPTAGTQPNDQVAADGRLIVYTGSMDVEVGELRPALDQAHGIVVGLGGHLAASSLENDEDMQYAQVTYRIPAERWSEALQALRGLGTRVITESTDSQDVTDQVVDLDARIANLRVTEAAFQTFMERATTIDDVLTVQRELTTVREDIEQLTAQREALTDRAALGTLSVTFRVPVVATSRASDGWDLGREIDNALATLVRFGQGLTSLAVWLLIVALPIALPVLTLGYLAVRLRRRWLATHPAPSVAYASAVPASVPPPGPYKPEG